MRVNEDEVQVEPDGFVFHQGDLFTGEVIEKHDNGEVMSITGYQDGQEHGPTREWYPDGTLRIEEHFALGRPTGTARKWHRNSRLAEEREFDPQGSPIRVQNWDESGKLTRDSR